MKTAVFGDIHGNLDLLKKMINKIRSEYGEDINILSVGDLVDRGPDSKGIVQLCIDEGVDSVMGNHDQWVVELLRDFYFVPSVLSYSMGGTETIKSYGVDPLGKPEDVAYDLITSMPDNHKEFFLNLKYYKKIEYGDKTYWVSHSGLRDKNVAKYAAYANSDDELVNFLVRERPNFFCWTFPCFEPGQENLYRFEKGVQVFGHSFVEKPIVKEDYFIALDTIGWGRQKRLTLSCVILPEEKIIQVSI